MRYETQAIDIQAATQAYVIEHRIADCTTQLQNIQSTNKFFREEIESQIGDRKLEIVYRIDFETSVLLQKYREDIIRIFATKNTCLCYWLPKYTLPELSQHPVLQNLVALKMLENDSQL